MASLVFSANSWKKYALWFSLLDFFYGTHMLATLSCFHLFVVYCLKKKSAS